MKKCILFALLPLFCFSQITVAAEEDTTGSTTVNDSSNIGIGAWGLGFALGIEQYREPYIETASIQGDGVNGRFVTTEKSIETRPSAWLTINWNLKPFGSSTIQVRGENVLSTKWGLFAGVKVLGESTEIFSAFALGPQVTFLTDKNREITIGLGWTTHPTKTYAKGIVEGESLPAQFDDIVYEEGTENSVMLVMSVRIL